MRFKIDENLPIECTLTLRDAGFDAESVGEEGLSGTPDSEILANCQEESRILLTLDLDFADIHTHPPASHPGILVLRSGSQDKASLISLVERLIPALQRRSPDRQLWIVEPHRIRFREK